MARPAELICLSAAVPELGRHRFRVLWRGEERGALLVRFGGVVYGWLNRCVHMPRELDCESSRVFDDSGTMLRCSMHGITYRADTGECLSPICTGAALTPVRVEERDGQVWLVDKRGRLPGGGI
jgi:nitrite reductase/ring-hydroxylating ferredoxin subunit